ncbi:MAG: hypothetical protein WEB29_11655 [Chloroflexota bacterium]
MTPVLITLLPSAALLAVLWRVTGDPVRSAVSVTAMLVPMLTFGYQVDVLGRAVSLSDVDALNWPLLGVNGAVFGLITVLVWRTRRSLSAAAEALAMIAVVFIALSLPGIANSFRVAASASGHEAASESTGEASPPSGSEEVAMPDIYYLVLDGYGRADVLDEVFGYNNQPFLNSLEDRGFYVAPKSLSNYSNTQLSIASSLNMHYLDDLPTNLSPRAARLLTALLEAPEVVLRLHRLGYKYVNFNTIWWGTDNAPLADVTYGEDVLSEFEVVFLRTTAPGRLLPQPTWQKEHLRTLSHLPDVARMPEPTFAFAHILFPHPPFVFAANGRQLRRDDTLGASWDDQEGYIEQMRFLNTWVLGTIDSVLNASDETPIFILQGDHGPFSTKGTGDTALIHWERMSILNALLVPPVVRAQLYPSITPVNTFRLVLRGLFAEALRRLPDRSMYSPAVLEARIDVTEEVKTRQPAGASP